MRAASSCIRSGRPGHDSRRAGRLPGWRLALALCGMAGLSAWAESAPATTAATTVATTVATTAAMTAATKPATAAASPAACRGRQTVEFCGQELPVSTTTVTCYERHGLGPQVPALDLSPLLCLPQLEALSLASGEIEFIERLKPGSLLRRLVLEETGLADRDLSPLPGLSGLAVLSLHASQVRELGPLAGLSQLRELDLSCTQVSDLSALRTLRKLQRLDLTRTAVRDLRIVAELPELTWLGLSTDAPIAAAERQALRARRPALVISEGRRY